MFSRISRYRSLPDVVTTDGRGRTLLSKALRPPSEAAGTFLHTLEEADRLDHLAYKYYRQSRKWWRINDGNPEFLSPLALLGKEPVVTDRFPVTFDGAQPPWTALVHSLRRHVGIDEVKVVEDIRLTPRAQTIGGQSMILHVEEIDRALLVTYNELNVSARDLAGIMTASGFVVGPPERLGRVGRPINIPRDVVE